MATYHLLFEKEYAINENIKIMIPTVGDVLNNEDEYYGLVSMITGTPYDFMVQLDDIGIDFTTINDYELFLLFFSAIKQMDTSLIFGELDITNFEPVINPENEMVVLRNAKSGAIIDMGIHQKIAATLRKINHLERTNKHPGNEEGKAYLLERNRKKLERRKKRKQESQLEGLIVALVCSEPFPYKYDEVRDMTIYQFNESVYQVIKKTDVNYKMHGLYSGTISSKDFKKDELNWLVHK